MNDPVTALTMTVRAVRANGSDPRLVIAEFVRSDVIVPSGDALLGGAGRVQPVFVTVGDKRAVLVFSSPERVGPDIREYAREAVSMSGATLARSLAPGVGIVVDRGWGEDSFEIDPETVEFIRRNAPA